MSGTFYQGDNLDAFARVSSASVDLVYLDPPFNTKRDYRFGDEVAFTDRWKWTGRSDSAFWALRRNAPDLWSILGALVELHGRTGTSAYLVAMAERLHALGRVLKPTGSLYLHCDPTACHSLRLLLDGVFGVRRFRGEIVWKRSAAHGIARSYGAVHDTILHYAAGDEPTWNGDGGHTDLWDDLPPINQAARERTGYPTQKPEALLARIIEASSRPGDLVLDPYAGSGTTLAVAEQLGRSWIGMDMGTRAWTITQKRMAEFGAIVELVRCSRAEAEQSEGEAHGS